MSRNIKFFDGAESSTTPTIGNLVASDLSTYANDAAFEAAEAGAPKEGNIYFNTTAKTIRFYNGTDWLVIPQDALSLLYDNGSSGLTATNVQAAIDEVEARVDTNETDISDSQGDISDLETLRGAPNPTNQGTFSGTTLTDNTDEHTLFQELETEVETKIPSSEKGSNNGVATLDGAGRVPSSQLTLDAMEFKGAFDASGGGSGSPSLTDGVGNTGDVYRVSFAGTVDHGAGSVTYAVGDSIIFSSTVWEKYQTSIALSGANTELSNLGTVAINTSLISDGDNVDNLGGLFNNWGISYTRFSVASTGNYSAGTDFNKALTATFQTGSSNTGINTSITTIKSGDQISSGTGFTGNVIITSGTIFEGTNNNDSGDTIIDVGTVAGAGGRGKIRLKGGS